MNLDQTTTRKPAALRRFPLRICAALTLACAVAAPAWSSDIVYAESNSPAGNSILTYMNDGTGKLNFVSSTPAGGIGVFDASFALGPFDSDQNLWVSKERSLLFAVNSGSNTIAVFHIGKDGGLTPVDGSPFPSGGIDPVSVGLKGDILTVVNKSQDPAQKTGELPNYTTFSVDANGALHPVHRGTHPVALGSSPSQALIASVGPFVFGADFLGGLLQSFELGENGVLRQNPPQAIADSAYAGSGAPHLPLGMRTHPNHRILYVDLVTVSKIAIYQYDDDGMPRFVGTVDDPGAAPCWAIVNHAGTRLYAINTGDNSVVVYDLSDPLKPNLLQHFVMEATTGAPFSAVIDDSDQFVYVSAELSGASSTPAANALHTLKVDPNGLLSEPAAPAILPITGTARAQGVAVFSAK